MSVDVQPGERPGKVAVATTVIDGVHYPVYHDGIVSSGNNSTTALNDTEVFTGEWEDVSGYGSIVVAVKTDQNGTFTVQFSPDGTNVDSTLTRYYRTNQIEAPHRFTVTRQYCRITFTNNSGSNQTYFRLQTLLGGKGDLNAPCDSNLAQDFDAIVTRPTDFKYEVALGRRQGASTWNKFGFNADVDIATSPEVLAAFGGTFTYLTSASALRFVSSSTDDDSGGIGANSLVVYGVDANWDQQIEVVTLDGTTNVDTTTTWLGINRVSIYLAGSSQSNVGTITITAITGGSTQATIPVGLGTTEQCIFFVPQNHQFLADYIKLNVLRQAAQDPKVTIKGWVFSAVSNAKYEVFREQIDTGVENTVQIEPPQPFVIGEKSVFWLEITTDKDNTEISGRFSGMLFRDVDA